MTRQTLWRAAVGIIGLLSIVIVGLTLVPQWLHPPLSDAELQGVPSAEIRIQLRQAQAQLQNNVRATLLQLTAGLLVTAGAAAAWRQAYVNRDGQITERFTRAVDQIGSDNRDVRIGGIYSLERIARNSPSDRSTIQYILAAFVRNHAPWPVGAPDGPQHPTQSVDEHLPWMRVRAPDIQAAMGVLGRRTPSQPEEVMYLSRVDLRSVALRGARLAGAQFRHANLARAVLAKVQLEHADLTGADLRRAYLERSQLARANLTRTCLQDVNLRDADLSYADLRGANLTGAILDRAVLTGALADRTTIWPTDVDAERRREFGVIEVDQDDPTRS
ncbi:pentapeptide repeat-containing protein [Kibdelosporangium aridum]|uniref:Pentapeptide repeat-containing protein n=1 Tax=Kibdelosporangium aridum TaxID=2030 RepID=A0A1W2D6V9_KIBAR|nr:pentapeptide repeat-containing protein [Kibdelosporangium aridum]SMC92778.1 Pentapeptide repeat-containing protein [Kibdelosporangium aridum]